MINPNNIVQRNDENNEQTQNNEKHYEINNFNIFDYNVDDKNNDINKVYHSNKIIINQMDKLHNEILNININLSQINALCNTLIKNYNNIDKYIKNNNNVNKYDKIYKTNNPNGKNRMQISKTTKYNIIMSNSSDD